jgi:hypothetical protein
MNAYRRALVVAGCLLVLGGGLAAKLATAASLNPDPTGHITVFIPCMQHVPEDVKHLAKHAASLTGENMVAVAFAHVTADANDVTFVLDLSIIDLSTNQPVSINQSFKAVKAGKTAKFGAFCTAPCPGKYKVTAALLIKGGMQLDSKDCKSHCER